MAGGGKAVVMAGGLEIYVSTLNFGPAALSTLGDLSHGGRCPRVEISSGHPFEPDIPAWLQAQRRRYGVSLLLHNYAPPAPDGPLINLADRRPAVQARTVEFLKSSIELTKRLGADYYSFHAGYRVPYEFGRKAYEAEERMSRSEALTRFIAALREVVAHAEVHGIHLGVENHVVESGNEANLILDGPDDFRALFEAVDSPFLHLHLDVGHLNGTSRTLGFDRRAFVQEFLDKVMAVHLHDNDGRTDQHAPFGKEFWFLGQLEGLSALRYLCLETATGGDQDRLREMHDVLQGMHSVPSS